MLVSTECDNDTQQVDIKVEDIKGEDIRYEVPPAENADSSGSLVVASDITVPPTDCAGPSPPVHQYICGVCQSVFAHRLLLTTHKRRLGHEWSKCDVCGRMLNCALKLAEHVCRRTVRRPTVCHQKFKCGFCRRSFACWVFLMTHLRSHSSGHVQLDHNYSRPTECCKLCTADPCGGKDPERHSRRSGRGTSRREKPEQHDQHQSGAYAGSRDVFPSVGEIKSVWEILSDVEFLPDGEFPSDGEFPLGGEFTPGGECLSDAEFLPDGTLTWYGTLPSDGKFHLSSQFSENPGWQVSACLCVWKK